MIRLATRGSPLALWQAEAVKAALRAADPLAEVELVVVRTQGDVVVDRPIADVGTNVFTAEVDRAVTSGRADVGVHSLKDLGTKLTDGLVLAATLARGGVEDVLVAPRHGTLAAMPAGARVGTGSPRRRAMLLAVRPDLVCVPLRGNVDTRLSKVDRGDVDATILARAGLLRLGLSERATEILPVDRFLPAAGQGLVGIVARASDASVLAALRGINDVAAFSCGLAERALLRDLGAGCHAPVGAHATLAAGMLHVRARVLSLDGVREIRAEETGPQGDAEAVGARAAAAVFARGGRELLA